MLSSIAKPFAALALAAALISIVLAALGASPLGVFAALAKARSAVGTHASIRW